MNGRRTDARAFCAGSALCVLLAVLAPTAAIAGGVVGTGTPASCTQSAFTAALIGGGSVTFNCGGTATITFTNTKGIGANTTIDGGGLITLAGQGGVGLFSLTNPVAFTIQNLTLTGGHVAIENFVCGTVTIANSVLSGNDALPFSSGAVFNGCGTLNISDSTIADNAAEDGALYISGTATIVNSTLANNVATGFGGGAIFNAFGDVTIVNSTLSANRTEGLGGGDFNRGGAIFNSGGSLTIINSTLTGNVAEGVAGAIYNTVQEGSQPSPTLTLANTIIANSVGGDCVEDAAIPVIDGGHNLIEDAASACGLANGVNGNLTGADPDLGPLADNGGFTETHALNAGSLAIDAGDDAVCAAPPVNNRDQRGYVRPGVGNAHCSIGAYELNAACPSGAPCTDDGLLCTADVCDAMGACTHPPGNAGRRCRDSTDLCDPAEHCDGMTNACPADAKLPDATSCSDGVFCNGAETCLSGLCTDGEPCPLLCDEAQDQCVTGCLPAPQSCRTADRSVLKVTDKLFDGDDRLTWKWSRGAATSQAEFADPTATADYLFCVYAGTASALVGQSIVPASATAWSAVLDSGYKFLDPSTLAGGIVKMLLKGSAANKSKIRLKGTGFYLPDLPLPLDEPITVQLMNGDNQICWGATYGGATIARNDEVRLKAKTP